MLLEQSADGARSTKDTILSNTVLVVTFLITVIAAWWIWREMGRVRAEVLRERRVERKATLAEVGAIKLELNQLDRSLEDASTQMSHAQLHTALLMVQLVGNGPFNPRDLSDILATPPGSAKNVQEWDREGR